MKCNKIFPIIPLISTVPMLVNLVGCNTASQSIDWTQEILDEYIGNSDPSVNIKGIVSEPRPSGEHRINSYLGRRIQSILGTDKDLLFDDNDNICLDIEATKGYEDKDMIIIQSQSDMIVNGLSNPKDLIHVKYSKNLGLVTCDEDYYDCETSIGAASGAGLSMILSILKHRNDFVHGPIRILITSDKELNMIGARAVKKDWLMYKNKYVKYLINLNHTSTAKIVSCGPGSALYGLGLLERKNDSIQNETEVPFNYTYKLTISGLHGGDIISSVRKTTRVANADKLAYELLHELFLSPSGNGVNNVQLVSHTHDGNNDPTDMNLVNQVIDSCEVYFNLENSVDVDTLNLFVANKYKDAQSAWRTLYPGEGEWKDVNINFKLLSNTEASKIKTNFFSKENSNLIINLLGSDTSFEHNEDTITSLHYGIYKYLDDEKTNPDSFTNVGPVFISPDWGESRIKFEVYSSMQTQVAEDQVHSLKWFNQKYKDITDFDISIKYENPIWFFNQTNPLFSILKNGYDSVNEESSLVDSYVAIEPNIFSEKSDNSMYCASIGPDVLLPNTIHESLYVKSIEPTVKVLLFAFSQIANAK